MNIFFILPSIELAIGLSLGLFVYYKWIKVNAATPDWLLTVFLLLACGGIVGLANWFIYEITL